MENLSRRDREQLRHRAEILSGAEAVFAEKGFHNATMEDIASRAEFAIGSLYKHFRSKEAIYMAIFEERLQRFVHGIDELVLEATSFDVALQAVLDYFSVFMERNLPLARIFHHSHGTAEWHKEDLRGRIEPNMKVYFQAIERLMARGVEEQVLRPLPLSDLSICLIGMLQGVLLHTVKRGQESDLGTRIAVVKSVFMSGASRPKH